jgi:hypothetical protein
MKKKIYSFLLISVLFLSGVPAIAQATEESSVEEQAPTEVEAPTPEETPEESSEEGTEENTSQTEDGPGDEETPEEIETPEEQSEQTEESNEGEAVEKEDVENTEQEEEGEEEEKDIIEEETIPAFSRLSEIQTDTAHTYRLTIRYQDTLVFDDEVDIPDTVTLSYHDSTSSDTVTTTIASDTALALLVAADHMENSFAVSGVTYYAAYDSYLLDCIDIETIGEACYNWQYVVDGDYPYVGMDQYTIVNGNHVYLYYGDRYTIEPVQNIFRTGIDTVGAILKEYDYETNEFATSTDDTKSLVLLDTTGTNIDTGIRDTSGVYTFSKNTPGEYTIGLDNGWNWYWPTTPISIVWPTRVTIRYQDTIVYDDTLSLAPTSDVTFHDSATTTTDTVTLTKNSVFRALTLADLSSDAFSLTDIVYYSSFDSYLINCVHIDALADSDACYNWQYVVNGEYPLIGMSDYTLADDDITHVYFYFGDRYQVSTNVDTYQLGSLVTSTLKEYDFAQNEYIPATDTTLTLALLNADRTAIATSSISTQGQATFTPSFTGAYQIGVDNGWGWYWPLTSFTVTTTPAGPETTTGGGSGSTATETSLQTTLTNIISFLDAHQNEDGSFANSASFSDWVALGYNAWTGSASGRDALKEYLLTNPNPLDGPNSTTAYARRAMALMSYGISPYNGTATNYIEKLKQTFDGTQFGVVGLVNDDIFALIPLLHTGYSTSDPIVASTTQYILSQQQSSGSFGDADTTGAALQVLSELTSLPGVNEAITKAKAYLLAGQQNDGGFGNVYGTPWIMQGLSSSGTDIDTLTKNGKTPIQYIQDKQGADGSIGASTDTLTNRIWASAYALPALLKKSWGSLLSSFPKPSSEQTPDQSAGNGTEDNMSTSTIDMSTPTSTPPTGGGIDENEQEVTKETSSTTEVTILLDEETLPVQTSTPPVRIQARATSQVAGTKIAEDEEDAVPTSTLEQANTTSTSVDTVPEPQNGSQKPLQYAFGLTILLGLFLGWKFLRTLV